MDQWQPPGGSPHDTPDAGAGAVRDRDAWSSSYDPDRESGTAGTLRPLTLADVLDGMFRLLFGNIRAFFLTLLPLVLPIAVIDAFAQRTALPGGGFLQLLRDPTAFQQFANRSESVAASVAQAVSSLVSIVTTPLLWGLFVAVAARAYLRREPTPGNSWRDAGRRYFALLGATVLLFLGWLAVTLPTVIILFGLGAAVGRVGLVVAALLIVLAVLAEATVALLFGMYPVAVVVEGAGPIRALGRSWRLARRRFWPYIGTMLLSGLVFWMVGMLVGLLFTVPGLALGGTAGAILAALGGLLTSIFVSPLFANALVLEYFDLRVRTEGLDLQLSAGQPETGAWAG